MCFRTLGVLQDALAQHGSNQVFMHLEIVSRWLLLTDDLKKIESKSALLGELIGEPGGGVPTMHLWSSVQHLFQFSPWDPLVGSSVAGLPSLEILTILVSNLVRALPIVQAKQVAQMAIHKAELEAKHDALSHGYQTLGRSCQSTSSFIEHSQRCSNIEIVN
jgi:hypothetical protein